MLIGCICAWGSQNIQGLISLRLLELWKHPGLARGSESPLLLSRTPHARLQELQVGALSLAHTRFGGSARPLAFANRWVHVCNIGCLRRGPGSASGNGTPWARAASGWLVGWNRLYFVNFGYPFNRRYTRAPRICMAAQQHDTSGHGHGLQTHVTSAVLMIASSKQTQPYGSLLPENNTPVS